MPAAIDIQFSQEDMQALKTLLADIEKGVPKVLARAINKAADGAKTDMVFIVREQYNYKAAAVRDRISVTKATYAKLSARTRSTGGPVHLTDMTGTTWSGPKSQGTLVNVKKDTGRKLIKSAWIGYGQKSDKKIVYTRTDETGLNRRATPPGRYPIKALYAPHPEIVYNTEPVWKSLQYLADYTLTQALEHETNALIKGYTR